MLKTLKNKLRRFSVGETEKKKKVKKNPFQLQNDDNYRMSNRYSFSDLHFCPSGSLEIPLYNSYAINDWLPPPSKQPQKPIKPQRNSQYNYPQNPQTPSPVKCPLKPTVKPRSHKISLCSINSVSKVLPSIGEEEEVNSLPNDDLVSLRNEENNKLDANLNSIKFSLNNNDSVENSSEIMLNQALPENIFQDNTEEEIQDIWSEVNDILLDIQHNSHAVRLLKELAISLFNQFIMWEMEEKAENMRNQYLHFCIVNSNNSSDKEISRSIISLLGMTGLKGKSISDFRPGDDIIEFLWNLYKRTDVIFILASPNFTKTSDGWHHLFNKNVAMSDKDIVPLTMKKWGGLDDIFTLKDIVPVVLDGDEDFVKIISENILDDNIRSKVDKIREEETLERNNKIKEIRQKVISEIKTTLCQFSGEHQLNSLINLTQQPPMLQSLP